MNMKVEGRNPVLELFDSNLKIDKIYMQKDSEDKILSAIIRRAKGNNIAVKRIPWSRLKDLAETGNSQGVVAFTEDLNFYSPDDLLELAKERDESPFVVILDQIQDPHNLGAIIRTSFAAGVHGVIFPDRRACGITPAVIKSSAGAALHLPLARVTNINYTLDQLKDKGMWIAAADTEGSQVYYDCDLKGSLGIVVGSEGSGLRRLVRENCDFLLKIPMEGEIGSLNASVAAGIIIFEALRQRS
ncbi:MAG: 23S rRNA (guanosine(2251)-2'-O)-methyltransferase RlmB [Halanaerobiaceae bacterium]